MNKDEHKRSAKAARLHQRERMRAWVRVYDSPEYADQVLAEFDKRFPAPTSQSATPPPPAAQAVEVAPSKDDAVCALNFIRSCAVNGTLPSWLLDGKDIALAKGFAAVDAELAALREKARLWDAVASRKVRLTCDFQGMFAALFDKGEQVGGWQTSFYTTAAEAVQAAIDSGALAPGTRDAGALK